MKYIYNSGLHKSIRCKIKCGRKNQNLQMTEHLLVYNWEPHNIPFQYYTPKELRTIHRTFGHPAIKATEYLLRRGRNDELEKKSKEAIRAISEEGYM